MRKWRWRIWWAWNFLSGGADWMSPSWEVRFKHNNHAYPGVACPGYGGPGPRHFGDPCVHCGIPHDDVPVGPCQGVSTKSS